MLPNKKFLGRPQEIIIRETHRGLWYEDGVLTQVLPAGRYAIPRQPFFASQVLPRVEIVLVDVRGREMVVMSHEIQTADRLSIRAAFVVYFRVTDPVAAVHEVKNYEERLHGEIQLAMRRTLSVKTLEEILANRNQLGEEILFEIGPSALFYGVTVSRVELKDVTFPEKIKEMMNRAGIARTASLFEPEPTSPAARAALPSPTAGRLKKPVAGSEWSGSLGSLSKARQRSIRSRRRPSRPERRDSGGSAENLGRAVRPSFEPEVVGRTNGHRPGFDSHANGMHGRVVEANYYGTAEVIDVTHSVDND